MCSCDLKKHSTLRPVTSASIINDNQNQRYDQDADMEFADCLDLEKRAKKHATETFSVQNPTENEELLSVSSQYREMGCITPGKKTGKLRTPQKKNPAKTKNVVTPGKSGKKCNPCPPSVSRKGKEITNEMENDGPASIMFEEPSSMSSDLSETEGKDTLDHTLNKKAKNINLSKRNVKSIIHHLLTNEHVIKLYKDVLCAPDTGTSQESGAKSDSLGTLDCFPTMTRSKVKDFMEKSNIPPSPSKQQKPGPSILDLDFAEEEDDDEYSPDKEEINETDDDENESVISSYLSEFGSPCPVTPSTPVPLVPTDRPVLSMSPSSINSPLTSATNRLQMDLSACEGLSDAEDDGNIALRTRSKKSLTDTALVDIEQAFIAPDITADMYDTCYEDNEWTEFLNSLYKTTDESTVDDEVNDPEFNYIAEAEQEKLDDEDFRFDKPTKVSRKELNILIEELHDLFEDEVLPLQVVAEASSPQDPISQLVTSNWKETPVLYQPDRPLVPLMPPHTPQIVTTLTPQTLLSSTQNSQIVLQPGIQYVNPGYQYVDPQSQYLSPDGSFKIPNTPNPPQTVTHTQSSLTTQNVETTEQRGIIMDNIRKHVQLLAQTFLLSKAKDDGNSCKIANTAKELLTDLHLRKSAVGSGSILNVCNLDEALQVVSKPFVGNEGNKNNQNSQNLKQIEIKMTLFNSSAFMYPHLLPKFEQIIITKSKKSKSSDHRVKFLPSEDNLIALGLEQFANCSGAFPSEFVHRYLVRGKGVNEIYHRIRFLSSSKAGINHVKKLKKLNQPVQLDPPTQHFVDFRPPRLKTLDVLPSWCQELANAQVLFSCVDNLTGNVVSSSVHKHRETSVDGKVIPIQPKLTTNLISSNIQTHCMNNSTHLHPKDKSSLISSSVILKKCVSKNMSSPDSSQSKKKRGKNGKMDPTLTDSPLPAVLETVGSPPVSACTDKDSHQSPDLLAKTLKSCGIGVLPNSPSFPSPKSSSTPELKLKPSSVKNLNSAFDESEIITANQCESKEAVCDDIEDPSAKSGLLRDNQNQSLRSNDGSRFSDSNPSADSSITCETIDCTVIENTAVSPNESPQLKRSKNVNIMDRSGETIDDTQCGRKNDEEENKDSDSDAQNTGTSSKSGVIQFIVIKRPAFKTMEGVSEETKGKSVHSDVKTDLPDEKGDRKDMDEIKSPACEPLESFHELTCDVSESPSQAVREASVDNSPNKLVPWISSMISQFEEKDPSKKKKATPAAGVKNISNSPLKEKCAPRPEFPELPLELIRVSQSSPIKVDVFADDSHLTPTKLHSIAPKMPCSKSAPYVPLPRISPRRKELNRQVRHILPKSFVFETKNPSPTKTTALSLKKKATLLCQKSPVKILPRPANAPVYVETRIGNQSFMLRRSQRARKKTRKREEMSHRVKVVKRRLKKIEEDSESAKETESEASEVEESGLSQEEDEDRMKLDDLMAASTTISFGSKQQSKMSDEDIKTKAKKKKAMSLSLLQPDLVQTDPKKDDRDTAFAQQYFNQVKETLSSDPDRFYKFLSLLKDLNKDHTSPVELYLDMVSLLSDHHQLVEDFSGFLLSFQAVECQCFSTNFQYAQIRQFLRQVETHCGASANSYHKVLTAMSTWSSMCQEGKLEGNLREKMSAILKNVPGVLDNLISYFLDGVVTNCHRTDFEDVCLDDEMEEANEFECVVLPNEREDYNTKSCSCQCHSNPQDERFHRRIKHCISCSLQMYEGQPVLKMSRNEYRPMSIIYPSDEQEEKEKIAKAKKEAAQIALAKAKVQQQQKGKKRKKELKGSKAKKICTDKNNTSQSTDVQNKDSVESGSETAKAKDRKKQVRGTATKRKQDKGSKADKKSKPTSKNEKAASSSSSRSRSKEEQMSKSDKSTKSSYDKAVKPSQKSSGAVSAQVSKPTKVRVDTNKKQNVEPPSVEVKESKKVADTVEDKSPERNNPGVQPLSSTLDEENSMENMLENESNSELFDRFILDRISDEGLTDAALRTIHEKFSSTSIKEIQDRAQQLLSLLETMSDASTDVDDSAIFPLNV